MFCSDVADALIEFCIIKSDFSVNLSKKKFLVIPLNNCLLKQYHFDMFIKVVNPCNKGFLAWMAQLS